MIIIEKIPIRLMFTIFLLMVDCSLFCNLPNNPYGIIKLLLTIVESPMEETTIIEIAAENPPRKTITVNVSLPKN